ncbi:MAG: AAA family ATPase [Pseudomonadales bacterium]|nr:AAA family ATPase [Pseudomonadales bacterium]
MSPRTIGIFGLSGVGKTTLISQFLTDRHDYIHLQASTLIKRGLANSDEHIDTLRLKNSDGINDNQQALVREFLKERNNRPDINILFDGHIIIDTDKERIEIPYQVINDLNLTKIIIVTASEDRILHHRRMDSTRSRPQRTLEEINDQQEQSIQLCQEYAERSGIPFFQIEAGDINRFADKIIG